jgi:oxygen-independent coproporphyrinogen-3 oxidase
MTITESRDVSTDDFGERLSRALDSDDDYPYVYTYPPKSAYRPFAGDTAGITQAWAAYSGPLGVYAHVPFCTMSCAFCTLFTTTGPAERARFYAADLLCELDLVTGGRRHDDVTVTSVYVGGGTPSLLPVPEHRMFLRGVADAFPLAPDAEIGLEAAPDSVTAETLEDLVGLGYTRVSFGVQSFRGQDLAGMGRRYDPNLGRVAPALALSVGVPNVNIDLMYGIPGQSTVAWDEQLTTAVGLNVPTITLYPLVVRDHTRYASQRRLGTSEFLDRRGLAAHYDLAVRRLAAEGYEQHSLVTFARPGGGNAHEAGEFTGRPTLGLGAGARSYAPSVHYTADDYSRPLTNQTVIDRYRAALAGGRLPVASAVDLDPHEQRRRYLILSLLHDGADAATYEDLFGSALAADFPGEVDALIETGLAEVDGERLILTSRGRARSSLIGWHLGSDSVRAHAGGYR